MKQLILYEVNYTPRGRFAYKRVLIAAESLGEASALAKGAVERALEGKEVTIKGLEDIGPVFTS
ncbi:MAG TPA: hypothetical protein VN455_00070 [Methanotrichaceae archaeon]|nr:hypothetical protein [Methanotrichaceae archaeon]